jgi:RND family efflux transporter MFP subunit
MSENRHAKLGIHENKQSPDAAATPPLARAVIMRRAKLTGAAILLLLVAGTIINVVQRRANARALSEAVGAQSTLYVSTINAKAAGNGAPLLLPGTLQGIMESPIYARSSGYVLHWFKDIGSQVKKGDVLAEIDTPEIDQQLSQAIAARQQAASSLELARSSAERWEALRKKDAVTQQELNERNSAFTQGQANLAAAEANVRRLQKLESFKQVVAPFAGVVTRRNVEVGDLIDAGNGGAGKALFTLAQVDSLRVYVYVPQTYSQRLKAGDEVNITQTEMPGQVFKGRVVRTAGAIDPATRTLQIEINLPNQERKLLAGAYVQAAIPLSGSSSALLVPSNVLLFRPEGPRIAVAGADGRVKLHTVSIGHDLGNALEILSGIGINDKLIVNPPDSLADNDPVSVVQPKTSAPPAGTVAASAPAKAKS